MEKEFLEKLRSAWSLDTCYPRARRFWNEKLPELGHCTITSLLIQEMFGGTIVHNKDNYHFWNILPDGTEVDTTIKQFDDIPEGSFMQNDGPIHPEELLKDFDVAMRFELLKSRIN